MFFFHDTLGKEIRLMPYPQSKLSDLFIVSWELFITFWFVTSWYNFFPEPYILWSVPTMSEFECIKKKTSAYVCKKWPYQLVFTKHDSPLWPTGNWQSLLNKICSKWQEHDNASYDWWPLSDAGGGRASNCPAPLALIFTSFLYRGN